MVTSLPLESEASLLSKVTEAAHLYGWTTYHTRRSDRSEPGWPDLVLGRYYGKAKKPQLMIVELKKGNASPSHEQLWWLWLLEKYGIAVGIWRTTDRWESIVAFLESGPVAGSGDGRSNQHRVD